jgi:methylthioribose-1-phosphate isomerase
MANILNRTTGAAAANLLGRGEPVATRPQRTGAWAPSRLPAALRPAVITYPADDTYRSPYRLADAELMILDQRGIPSRFEELVARRGADVAYYLRLGACRGGPLMAQLAAYGLALTAAERAGQPPETVDRELERTARALTLAWPSSRLVAWAVARLRALPREADTDASGEAFAATLRAEADAIANHLQAAHGAIVESLIEQLPEPPERPLAVLVHGDPGALAGGLMGTAITALVRLRADGRRLRVFVTETRPYMEGARPAAWELRQAGIGYQVITDGAVAWLFERETIDAVLIGAEWIAANGDTGAVVGSRAIAQLAAAAATRPGADGPRVVVAGVSDTIDPATAEGSAIPADLRSVRDLVAYLDAVPIGVTEALVPATDVIPAGSISALVTERGVLAPPAPASIAAILGTVADEPG